MKYYKLILDKQIIGAIDSTYFTQYQPVTGCFLLSNEEDGEYIDYNGKLYRATWMHPITKMEPFITIQAIEISEEDYQIYIDAINSNKIIEEENEVEEQELEPIIPYISQDEINSLDFIRTSKLSEMSHACRKTIENGFDLELRNEVKHFSLDTQDQLNLITLNAMADTEDSIPYHADGEECIFYTAAEIKKIVAAANNFKIYQTTYYNALKAYINSLETIEDVAAVEYGMIIPEEYQTEVLKSL